jgi:vacuolar-type H+-ATPase subunit H
MSEVNQMSRIEEITKLVEQAKGHADRLYNKNVKKAATDYRNVLLEITKVIKEERPSALEFSRNIKK